MKSTSTRRAAIAALALAPVLAACGFNAPTDQVYQAAEGVNDRDGQVDVLNALIVSGEDGSGTLAANLVNNDTTTADQLTGVTGTGVTVPASVFSGPGAAKAFAIPAGGALNLATDGRITVEGTGVTAGAFVRLTLTFANGESSSLRVPVVRNDGDYVDVPLPSASPTDQPTSGTTIAPSGSPSTPAGEPSQEPTGSNG